LPEHARILDIACGFISIDSEWLVVKINEGLVVSARIVTD
jgi:hypothetical protein